MSTEAVAEKYLNSSTACRPLGMPPGLAVVRVLADCSTIIAARRDGSRVDAALSRSVGEYGERRGAADRNRSAPPPGRVTRSPPTRRHPEVSTDAEEASGRPAPRAAH